MKKVHVFSAVLVFLFSLSGLFAANNGVQAANRKTAVRCLKLAESYLSSGDWGNALSQAELGLAYDESVADLWYVKAASQSRMGEPKAVIIPMVTKALTEGQWVDYNRDGARILYADMLCDTGNYGAAVSILDANPFIYSADAEFIRIKAYYCMHTKESVEKARDKINSARKIYPQDKRFPHLFFKFEYDFRRPCNSEKYAAFLDDSSVILVQKIADSFIARMPEYENPDAELEIYSAAFTTGEKQKRMLQAFTAHGMKHPLYAETALKAGLIGQQEAWDYFTDFADKNASKEMLEDILPCITDEITVESVKEHLNAYEGLLTIDTDDDCEPNMNVKFLRGRPEFFEFDADNDGINEWSCRCDFGVPESLELTQGNVNIVYGTYPSITQVIYKNPSSGSDTVFYLADETYSWSPFDILRDKIAYELFKADFFLPEAKVSPVQFDEDMLLAACSFYEMPSMEKPGASIKVNVVHGFPETADYCCFNTVYAHAVFENGLPVLRSIDNDDDGIFETTEFYGYDKDYTMHISSADQEQVMTNLFGLPMSGSGIYLKMIQIDQNGDTVPDFTEEYLADNGKITSWDYDGDGNWNVRYKRYPVNEDGVVIEDAQFYKSPDNVLVTISLWNGIPVKVVSGEQTYIVTQGAQRGFYWVGTEGSADDELFVQRTLDPRTEQGVTVILQSDTDRIQAVKIADVIYCEILPEPAADNSDKTENNEN